MPTVAFVAGLLLIALGVGAYFFWPQAGDQPTKAKIPGFEVEVQNAALGFVVLGIVLMALALSYSGRSGDAPAQSPRPPEATTTNPTPPIAAAPVVPPPSTGVPGQTTAQPPTVAQSPTPVTPTTPSAQPQQPSTPEDAADNARMAWRSITEQINELTPLLDSASGGIEWWQYNALSPTAQPIRDILEGIGSKIDKIRKNLNSLRLSYRDYPDIRDALEQTHLSAGATPIPGTVFDNLLHSIDGVDGTFSKDIAMPYVRKTIDDIQALRDWQAMVLKKAPH